jgi:hypothetical protein
MQIHIEFLTHAQRRRRSDWAIARASFHNPGWGSSANHTIHDFNDYGRLSVGVAAGTILHATTKDEILQAYHMAVTPDRYKAERELYGIWDVATCNDRAEPHKHYIVNRMNPDTAPAGVRPLGLPTYSGRGRNTRRFYDWAATMALAAREGWGMGAEGLAALTARIGRVPTAEEITTAVVEQDYQYLNRWCNDEWSFVGVVVVEPITGLRAALWGIESDQEAYHAEVAKELADQILNEDLGERYQDIERIAAQAGIVLEGIK